jgi:hypothetical protein
MRHLSYLGIALLCVSLTACGQQSTSGGPGATDSKARDNPLTQEENTFKLDPPNLATRIKQGQSDSVTIGIGRGKNFAEDVALKLDGVPSGVTIDPPSPTIKASDSKVTLNIAAAANAALGDHTVKVTGHPTKGKDGTSEFKLSIVENK